MDYKKLYIIRHGETDFNKNGMVQGSGIDASLNEKGQNQAESFYRKYGDFPFDKLYISRLIRTQQSVQKFIEKGLHYEKIEGLNEISWGAQEGQPFSLDAGKMYQKIIGEWSIGNLDLAVAGGESPNQVMARQKVAMDYIMGKKDEKEVLICMHGRAMRILICWLLNYDLSQMDMFAHDNLGLYELTHTGSMFKIDRFNDTSHCRELSSKF